MIVTTASWRMRTILNAFSCAARRRQRAGTTGKIRSTLFDGINDITTIPPATQAAGKNISGEDPASHFPVVAFVFRNATTRDPLISKLQAANFCSRWGILKSDG